jgi:hypothetical protein
MILGTRLEALAGSASRELLLVAPYIKATSLERVLECLSTEIPVTVVTRWRVDEIVNGVSDLEVWPILSSRRYSRLFLHDYLHAKYYRADNQALIGSANLTQQGMGWSKTPNLEILEATDFSAALIDFERVLMARAVLVDDRAYRRYLAVVTELKLEAVPQNYVGSPPDLDGDFYGLVRSRTPENLFLAYSGGIDLLTSAAQSDAIHDLEALKVPSGLSQLAFKEYVAARLQQSCLIIYIDDFLSIPRRFGEVRYHLGSHPLVAASDVGESDFWQTLMRWMLYFLSDDYLRTRPNHTEVFQKRVLR